MPKRSKLGDLVEASCEIKPLGFTPSRQFNNGPGRPHVMNEMLEREAARGHEQLLVRLARQERSRAEAAAIIAAAAAAQKEAEERALVEAATAAEEQSKEEEKRVERERRRKDRKEREEKRHGQGHGREDDREKRLLKLVGAVVVKTMSKYRARMEIDTFKKHAKEVRRLFVPSLA
jgi:histone-lysine N-methyltransferase SETD2